MGNKPPFPRRALRWLPAAAAWAAAWAALLALDGRVDLANLAMLPVAEAPHSPGEADVPALPASGPGAGAGAGPNPDEAGTPEAGRNGAGLGEAASGGAAAARGTP